MLFDDRWMRSPFAQVLHKGGSAPVMPGPSDEERELQRVQTDILKENQSIVREQTRQQELLAPFIYKSAGITPRFDSSGKIVGFDETPQAADPNKALEQQIQTQLLNRSLAALRGELPVDAGLMRELGESDKRLADVFAARLGPGWETSTPGIEALTGQSLNRSQVLDAARRGDITLGESLSLARSGDTRAAEAERVARLAGASDLRSGGVRTLGEGAAGFGQVTGQMANERARQFQAQMSAYQQRSKSSPFESIAGLALGSVLGGAGAKFGGGFGTFASGKLFP